MSNAKDRRRRSYDSSPRESNRWVDESGSSLPDSRRGSLVVDLGKGENSFSAKPRIVKMSSQQNLDDSSSMRPRLSKFNSIQSIDVDNSSRPRVQKMNSFNLDSRQTNSVSGLTPTPSGAYQLGIADNINRNSTSALEDQLLEERKYAIQRNSGPTLNSIRNSSSEMFRLQMFGNKLDGPTIVTNNIVLGGRDDAADKTILRKLGVTHVLNVAAQVPNFHEGSFIYCKINLIDAADTQLIPHMGTICALLSHVEDINARILVHCISGVSRSVSVIILHMMMTHKLELNAIYSHIKKLRPYISPNDGFKMQLVQAEVKELGYSTVNGKQCGKDWDFFALNTVKGTLPSKPAWQPVKSHRVSPSSADDHSSEGRQRLRSSSSSSHDESCCAIS